VRVLAAMSGGVDSSVAAALLLAQGFEVVGVTMYLFEEEPGRTGGRSCCGSAAVRDAQRVAAKLGFPHYAWDFRPEFERSVIADFESEYALGRTPNPCIRCNELVKFRALLDRAPQLGAELVATGHHARVERDAAGVWQLLRGRDRQKDQSYFLYSMTQKQLARVLFPVGGMQKSEVRQRARELGLSVADKPESQDICFVPGGDYPAFLRGRRPDRFRPGPVLDAAGNMLGRHDGTAAYTIGQRKGLGLAFGERRYVVRIDHRANAVVLGTEAETRGSVVEASGVNWVAGSVPVGPVKAHASVRYQSRGGTALVEPLPGARVRVRFDEPQFAPAPGQAVVFWQDDRVLGGGTIEQAGRE
jgi:tRNA-specific 2-thiouridylase